MVQSDDPLTSGMVNNGVCGSIVNEMLDVEVPLPEAFYSVGESHWGGCGCLGTTRLSNNIQGFALGFRGKFTLLECVFGCMKITLQVKYYAAIVFHNWMAEMLILKNNYLVY